MRQLLLLVALCLWSATATAQSQADPSTGSGTFVTPGYGTSGTASRPSAMPGQILSTPGAHYTIHAARRNDRTRHASP
jgi:hypothetical protein